MENKYQFAKANRFKLVTAGGNGVFRTTTYRKYVGKKYLTVKFQKPEYEYDDLSSPEVEFKYGDHTYTLVFPRWTKLTGDEFVVAILNQSLSWCGRVKATPKQVAQEAYKFTCYNEICKKVA